MSENCHNHGKIYWNFLCDSMVHEPRILDNGYTVPDVCMKRKQLIHFLTLFIRLLKTLLKLIRKRIMMT